MRVDRKGYEKMLYQQHLHRLQNIRSTIDTDAPKPPPAIFSRKLEIEYKRKMEKINRDNRALVARLCNKTPLIDNTHSRQLIDVRKFKQQILDKKWKQWSYYPCNLEL
jgi:hypothetical protein